MQGKKRASRMRVGREIDISVGVHLAIRRFRKKEGVERPPREVRARAYVLIRDGLIEARSLGAPVDTWNRDGVRLFAEMVSLGVLARHYHGLKDTLDPPAVAQFATVWTTILNSWISTRYACPQDMTIEVVLKDEGSQLLEEARRVSSRMLPAREPERS